MDNIKMKMGINYHWKTDNGIDIPEKHREALEEDAIDRIFEQIKEGNTQGELITTVRFGQDMVLEEDDEEGISYSGWWGVSKQLVGKTERMMPSTEFRGLKKTVNFEPADDLEIATISAIIELLNDPDLTESSKKRIIEYIDSRIK